MEKPGQTVDMPGEMVDNKLSWTEDEDRSGQTRKLKPAGPSRYANYNKLLLTSSDIPDQMKC